MSDGPASSSLCQFRSSCLFAVFRVLGLLVVGLSSLILVLMLLLCFLSCSIASWLLFPSLLNSISFWSVYACCPLGMSIHRDILSFYDVMILTDVSGRFHAPPFHRFEISQLSTTLVLLPHLLPTLIHRCVYLMLFSYFPLYLIALCTLLSLFYHFDVSSGCFTRLLLV